MTTKLGDKKPRYLEIDFLKAIAAVTVVLIHVLDVNRSTQLQDFTWDLLHFAVGVFVFASGFLQASGNVDVKDLPRTFKWLKKRLVRLLAPYYLYALCHTLLIALLPSVFSRFQIDFSVDWVLDTLLLRGGVGFNWITRLFVMLTLGYLGLEFLRVRLKFSKAYLIAFVFGLAFSLVQLIYDIPVDSKYTRAIPWMSVFILGMATFKSRNKKKFATSVLAISGISWVLGYIYLRLSGGKAGIFSHKYPPSFYFVAYNVLLSVAFYLLGKSLVRRSTYFEEFKSKGLEILWRFTKFVSKHSYSIFFAHLIVLDLFGAMTGWWLSDFVLITGVTLGIVGTIDWIGKKARSATGDRS